MILNSEEEKSLGSLLADKGIINAVRHCEEPKRNSERCHLRIR